MEIYKMFNGDYIDLSKIVLVSKPSFDERGHSFVIEFQLCQPVTINFRSKAAWAYIGNFNRSEILKDLGVDEPYTSEERFWKIVVEFQRKETEEFQKKYDDFITHWKNFKKQ